MPLELNGTTGVQGNSGAFVAGTAVASTSGTSIDFTSIPSWVKRITVMFSGVSTNSGSDMFVQVGNGSIVTSGYNSQRGYIAGSSANANATSTACIAYIATNNSSDIKCGHVVLTNVSGNIWVSSAMVGTINTLMAFSTGNITLSSALDRVRITTNGGTDIFDAGSINILYE